MSVIPAQARPVAEMTSVRMRTGMTMKGVSAAAALHFTPE
jgi:hypothetical protein